MSLRPFSHFNLVCVYFYVMYGTVDIDPSWHTQVVELKVRLHCRACEKAVRKALCRIKGTHAWHWWYIHNICIMYYVCMVNLNYMNFTGVRCVEIDVTSNKITVLGFMDRKMIVKAVRKTGRRAEVWPSYPPATSILSKSCCPAREQPTSPSGFRCILPSWAF